MVDSSEATEGIASLEAARARLEAALRTNSSWRALQGSVPDGARVQYERELAGDPLYKSWKLVGEAIENLRTVDGDTRNAGAEAAPDAQPEAEIAEFADEAPAGQHAAEDTAGDDGPEAPVMPAADGVPDDDNTPEEPLPAHEEEDADDLTQIRGVDRVTADSLAALGITRFAQIAAWRRDDVSAVAEALGLEREISKQNWIEQAALLERRTREDRPAELAPVSAAPPPEEEHPSEQLDAAPADDEPVDAVEDQRQLPQEEPDTRSSVDPSAPPVREIDLPDIIAAIRRGASQSAEQISAFDPVPSPAQPVAARIDEPAPAAIEERPAALAPQNLPENREDELALADAGAQQVTPENAPPTGPAPEPAAPPRSRIPTVAASAHVNTAAAERVRRLEEERKRFQQLDAQSEREMEAAVTFIVREPIGGSSSAVTPPRQALDRPETPYAPPPGTIEEAEVMVVGPEARQSTVPADDRGEGGAMRRLFRSFKGG